MYSWGANSYGQLGQGFCNEECLVPEPIDKLPTHPERVIQITGGAGHTLILSDNGEIFNCGNTLLKNLDENQCYFKKIEWPVMCWFDRIASGWDFSVALTKDHRVFTWGSNNFEQLGLSKEKHKTCIDPVEIEGVQAVEIACGLRHMVIVTVDGDLLSCGSNSSGQLGINEPIKTSVLKKIPGLTRIKYISCGQKHSLAVTNDDRIFVWGDNKWGQLGMDPTTISKSTKPLELQISILDEIKSIHCGWTHNIILTASGEVWTWGRNNYGQLGHTFKDTWRPQKISISNIIKVAVGAEHNLALSTNNHLYVWGWNEHGNCGTGNKENVYVPTVINFSFGDNYVSCFGCGTGQNVCCLSFKIKS